MAGGKRRVANSGSFTSETARTRGSGGRKKGTKNRWAKADLAKLREHIQDVLNRREGGIEGLLEEMTGDRKQRHMFVALLRDMAPKPAAEVKAQAEISYRWLNDDEEEGT